MDQKEKAMQIISAVTMGKVMADKMRPLSEAEIKFWEQWEQKNNWPRG